MSTFRTSILLLTLAGCDVVQTGEEGNFTFQYAGDLVAFGTPVAVSASAGVEVRDAASGELVDLTAASTDDASVLDVLAFADGVVTLVGQGAGEVTFEVDSRGLVDRVDMAAGEVASIELAPPTSLLTTSAAVLAQGGVAQLGRKLEDAQGSLLIGSGYGGFTFDPPASASMASTMAENIRYLPVRFDVAGDVTVSHPLAVAPLTLTVVPTSDIALIELDDALAGATDLEEGASAVLLMHAELADGTPVLGLEGVVGVQTTSTCTARPYALWGDSSLLVEVVSAGTCEVTIGLGSLASTWSVTVVEPS